MELARSQTTRMEASHAVSAVRKSSHPVATRALEHRLDRDLALSLGAIAVSLAALIYFAERDPVAVDFVRV